MRISADGRVFINTTAVTNTHDQLTVKRAASAFTEMSMTVDANTTTGNYANAFVFTKSKQTYWNGYGFKSSDGHIGGIVGRRDASATDAETEIRIEIGGTHINASEDRTWNFKKNGDLSISDGNLIVASGHGIDFSATGNGSGMSSELLDDYEEGSWTPSYGSSSVPSSSYSNTAGYYTLIGNTVFYTGRIQMSSSSVNSNPITMGGFPFTAASAVGQQGGFDITYIDNWYSGSSSTNAQVTFLNSGGTAYGYFYNGDGNTIAADATYDSARRTLHFKGFYFI